MMNYNKFSTKQAGVFGRVVFAALLMFLSINARADQGYAVLSADKTTLTFMYGTPTGTLNTDYFNTDDTQATGPGWFSNRASITTVVFDPSFAAARPKSCVIWFKEMSKLTSITGIEYLNTSSVTSMYYMFEGCSKLTSLDITNFDTSKVTSMGYMFSGCAALTSLDLTHFNTSLVTTMLNMFNNCTKLQSLDLSSFDTNKVTSMYGMFSSCAVLTSIEFGENFKANSVTNMQNMFNGCAKLPSLDLSNFNTSKVTNMMQMFAHCTALTSLDLSSFNTTNVTNMQNMFYNCSSLPTLDLSSFNTNNVTNMSGMFYNCSSLPTLDLSSFNTSKVTNMMQMFYGCSKLPSLDVTHFNTSNVTNMQNMFNRCAALTSLDLSHFNTSKVTTMEGMFYICTALTSIEFGEDFKANNVTTMYNMFSGCAALTSLDLSHFNTSKVTNMSQMFINCSKLTALDLRSFNTKLVTTMANMFNTCSNLKSVTFGQDFSTQKLTGMGMFPKCNKLRYVDFYASDETNAITAAKYATISNGIPATAVVFLPHGSQEITDRQNVVYSYNGDENDLRCPNYYSIDKVDIEFPYDFKTNEAVYTRDMTGKQYGSVILPYDFTTNSDIQAYNLTFQNKMTQGLKFTNVETVPAHTPFAFKRLNKAEFKMKDDSGNFGITVYATRSTNAAEKTWTSAGPIEKNGSPYEGSTGLSDWKTKGYYVKETVTDFDGMFFIQNNDFLRAVGNLNLVDHRVLFYPTDATMWDAKSFTLSFSDDDLLTAIEAAETEKTIREATDIYDAIGRRQTSVKKGLNIVRMSDGTVKKVLIK